MFGTLVAVTTPSTTVLGRLFGVVVLSQNAVSDRTGVLLFAGVFLVVGVFLLYTSAADDIRQALAYISMETYDPSEEFDDETLLAVRGDILDQEKTVTGPLTGETCVAYVREDKVLDREVKKDTSVGRDDGPGNDDDTRVVYTWELRDAEQESVPFEIETEHGPVAVEPGYAELALPAQEVEGTSWFGRFFYKLPLGQVVVDRPTKTIEKHARPGETVTVIGDVQDTEEGGAVAAVRSSGTRGEFTITNRAGYSLVARSTLGALASSLPALLCFGIGIGALAIGIVAGVIP